MEQAWSGTKTFEGSRTLVADYWTKILWVGSSYRSGCQAFLRKKLLDCSAYDEILSEHEFYISEISKGFFSVKKTVLKLFFSGRILPKSKH